MYLFKDFILSINYGPTNGCGSHLCDVSSAGNNTSSSSSFSCRCLFTYFLARHKGGLHSPYPNIVCPQTGQGTCCCLCGACVCVSVCVSVCVFAKLRLPGYLSQFLLFTGLCVSTYSCFLSCCPFVCVCIWFSFTYEAP